MVLNNNDSSATAESLQAQTALASEIDLYAELLAFANLSPDEQSRLLTRLVPSSEPENRAPIETIESKSNSAEIGNTSADLVAKNNPPESVAIHSPEVQSEPGMRNTADWTVYGTTGEIADHVAKNNPPESVAIHSPEVQSEPGMRNTADWTVYGTTGEIVDAVKDVSTKEPVSEAPVSSTTGDHPSLTVTRPGPSGPLSGFNLPQQTVYTGAMSRGVCLACGAESDADDLFCLTCGGFMDEGPSTLPSTPMCSVCKHRIDPGEIFCPWCGCSAPA